jgi:DMSO/TMAO reductase YedYZ molybdopterin-dependent catalytic subunit
MTLGKQMLDRFRSALTDRRSFMQGTALAAMSAALGSVTLPRLARASEESDEMLAGKDDLILLNDRSLNVETPVHLLDDAITPTSRHFVRNNGIPPATFDSAGWTLTVDGFVDTPLELSIDDLKAQFETVTLALAIECGGNGRYFFYPPARGNQWQYGAVGCSEWTGVRLRDVLNAAGVQAEAIYTAHVGADEHLSFDPDRLPISRGMPIAKAMTDNVLIAFGMNGGPLHPMNGAPLRLVVPGWPASCSHKWLTRITLRDVVHDGPKMTGKSYRMPPRPMAPGEHIDEAEFQIIERMPVKSIITFPQKETEVGLETQMRGHAWSGDRRIDRVEWSDAALDAPVNDGAWQNWRADVAFPQPGYYELWARAIDSEGTAQPFGITWNPKGYLNNSVHRVAVRVG